MIPEDRRQKIMSLLKEKGYCSVEYLAEKVYVSIPTIRRDLTQLEKDNLIKRVHGGASYFPGEPQIMLPFELRKKAMTKEKIKIGEAAARLLKEYDSIFLDSSSTCLCLAKAINRLMHLTVMTNSFMIAQSFSDHPNVTVEMTGGTYQASNLSVFGKKAESAILHHFATYCFVTVNSVDAEYGFSNITEPDIGVKQAFAAQADTVVMLVDSSKLYRKNFYKVFDFNDIDIIITDTELDDQLHQICLEHSIKVIIAQDHGE